MQRIFRAVKALRSGLTPVFEAFQSRVYDLARMEIMLLLLDDAYEHDEQDFAYLYAEAELGDQSDAVQCHRELIDLEKRLSGFRLTLRGVADRIELVT